MALFCDAKAKPSIICVCGESGTTARLIELKAEILSLSGLRASDNSAAKIFDKTNLKVSLVWAAIVMRCTCMTAARRMPTFYHARGCDQIRMDDNHADHDND
ncbi:hypothetical protein E4U42_005836 [Claviceps africana]|uniref:Uncharacterized protein n=1 Tax=Claviceps africana TaxID=83212 RepID=A0A8K0NH61_9HYPO|nr:hypothetical protein E4U42_005836 [Claviceps africana]